MMMFNVIIIKILRGFIFCGIFLSIAWVGYPGTFLLRVGVP